MSTMSLLATTHSKTLAIVAFDQKWYEFKENGSRFSELKKS